MSLTGLAEPLLQMCADYLDFQQQRRFVRTCRGVVRAIDRAHSLTHIWQVEYPYNRVTNADVIMTIISRNRTSRLMFRTRLRRMDDYAHFTCGYAHQPYGQEYLLSRHLVQLCIFMPQLVQLKVAIHDVTETELNYLSKLVSLSELDLTFLYRSPSLRALVDGQHLLFLRKLVLTWHPKSLISQTIGMRVFSTPSCSVRSTCSSRHSSNYFASSTSSICAGLPSSANVKCRHGVRTWTRAPGFEGNYKKILELVDRAPDDGVELHILTSLRELDVLCPQLDLKPDMTRKLLRVLYGPMSVESDMRLRTPTLHQSPLLEMHVTPSSRDGPTIDLSSRLVQTLFGADYDGDNL
jgi:hypothetical protein